MKRTTTFFILIMLLLAACGQRLEGTPPQPPSAETVDELSIPATTAAPETSETSDATAVSDEGAAPTAVPEANHPDWETAVTACAAAGRDDVCQQGEITKLAQTNQVNWGLTDGDEPLLRLAADLDEGEGALTVMGLGAGQIVELTTLEVDETAVTIPFATTDEDMTMAEPDLPDVLEPAPQQITFFSEPGTADSPSGLLLAPTQSALVTSLGLNGTQVTLLGSAWAEAAPGGHLTLTVLSGDLMLSVADKTAVATTGSQITVPLTSAGVATGAPQTVAAQAAINTAPLTKLAQAVQPKPTTSSGGIEEDLLTPLVPPENSSDTTSSSGGIEEDLLTPLVPPGTSNDAPDDNDGAGENDTSQIERQLTRIYYSHFLRSYRRCVSGRPDAARYVYNTAYFLRILDRIPYMHRVLGESAMARLQDMARQCATFDVDFGSTMTLTGNGLTVTAETKAEGVHVQFTPGGGPFLGDVQALQYRSLTVSGMDVPGCALDISHPDGTLRIDDGLLAIQENGLRLRLNILPDVPQESFVYSCGGVSTEPSAPFNWFPLFMGLYADLFSQQGFTISDWHYVGGELMAEAILDRSVSLEGGTLAATTYLVLIHNPSTKN